jgi:hypothetical protein
MFERQIETPHDEFNPFHRSGKINARQRRALTTNFALYNGLKLQLRIRSDFNFSELMSAHRRSNSLTRIARVLPGQQLFSVAQAAAILGRSTPTIYRALCAGKINIVTTPLGRRIARGEIE